MKSFLEEKLGLSAAASIEPNNFGIYTLNKDNWKTMHTGMSFETVVVKFNDPADKESVEFKQVYDDLGKL